MNTEIFDYFRKLSKKEYFFLNFINTCLSIIVIFIGIICIMNAAGILLYTIMFGCTAVVLLLNAYKFIRCKSNVGWLLVAAGIFMTAVTVIGIMSVLNG